MTNDLIRDEVVIKLGIKAPAEKAASLERPIHPDRAVRVPTI